MSITCVMSTPLKLLPVITMAGFALVMLLTYWIK